jgi:predicted NUDIX family phosphoesterase
VFSDSRVLTVPKAACGHLTKTGTVPADIFGWPGEPVWLVRYQAETNPDYLQIIPYLLLESGARMSPGGIWCYSRIGGHEKRLLQQSSCGVGGHVEWGDRSPSLASVAENCLWRELKEEIQSPSIESLRPLCWLYENESEVGLVHLGLVFTAVWQPSCPPEVSPGESLVSLGFKSPADICVDERFELWSRLAVSAYISCRETT